MDGDGASFLRGAAVFIGGVFVLWLICFVIAQIDARFTPQAGEIGVVREGSSFWWVGDWFNGHNIKKVVAPGSGNTAVGLGSDVHTYPADSAQRYYTITGDPRRGDRPGVDVVEVATSDGIRVGLEGTFYFTTAFNGSPQGATLARDFDNRFGVRTFPVVGSSDELHAWDGNEGWSAFLDAVVRPIIDNDLRQSIGSVTCAQLVASCALVYNQNVSAVAGQHTNNQATITAIQNKVNSSIQTDIRNTIGADYFANIKFLITGKPKLPDTIQQEIDRAQAQFAAVGTSEAKKRQATIDAQTNAERQKGYAACPACAAQDVYKSIPPSITTFAPGQNFSITH